MKCNQSRPGIELVSPCPFPTTITITPRAPPFICLLWLFWHLLFLISSRINVKRYLPRTNEILMQFYFQIKFCEVINPKIPRSSCPVNRKCKIYWLLLRIISTCRKKGKKERKKERKKYQYLQKERKKERKKERSTSTCKKKERKKERKKEVPVLINRKKERERKREKE